ncbi:tetratricopeptide repeat protein [Kordia periserrulae]|uniref:Tetratricopeptide repeat protein n=1 Tax=Kordia periserrulae TaxID=701523 RepID=A0A2T6BSB1_9FLAO|nr:tetratricopeptide repeat protein [Kordia periserrulae]PTX58970.1 tetratricopeptide repeat protein [Kordia periserrulae]
MSQKSVITIVFLFLISSTILVGQTSTKELKTIWENTKNADSIRFKALAKYFKLNNQAQPDSTLIVLDYYYDLAKEKNATEELFHVANNRGNIYRLKGESDIAMSYYKAAESIANQLSDLELKAIILGNIGNVHIQNKDYKQATQHFSNSLKIYQETHNKKGESHMLTSLGSVFLIIQNYEAALEYYQKALSISENTAIEDRRIAVIYLNIGWANFKKNQFEEARKNYEKALKIVEQTKDKFFALNGNRALANIHINLGNYEKATSYAKKNMMLSEELHTDILHGELIFARLAFKKNRVKEAIQKAEAVLAKLDSNSSIELRAQVFELLYNCYKDENNTKKSLEMFEQFILYKDSIQLEKNNFAVIREAVKNEFDLKLYENKLESEKAQANLKLRQLKNTFYIIFCAILLIAGILFYFNRTQRKNKEKREELLQEINRLKNIESSTVIGNSKRFELNKTKIENAIAQKLNETDWNILNILLNNPVVTNKEIAEKAFMSVHGIGSALRRMYLYFDIKDSKYKKTELIREAIKISRNP